MDNDKMKTYFSWKRLRKGIKFTESIRLKTPQDFNHLLRRVEKYMQSEGIFEVNNVMNVNKDNIDPRRLMGQSNMSIPHSTCLETTSFRSALAWNSKKTLSILARPTNYLGWINKVFLFSLFLWPHKGGMHRTECCDRGFDPKGKVEEVQSMK